MSGRMKRMEPETLKYTLIEKKELRLKNRIFQSQVCG